jgi:hypothetical protein
MIQNIKNKLLILAAVFMFALPVAVPVAVSAANANPQEGTCYGADQLGIPPNANPGTDACATLDKNPNGTSKVNDLIKEIVNILSIVVGIVAVVMIIIGGFRYITSGGASEKVTGAKNTILYALIGLVIVALAQVIVRFVLSKTTTT